MRRKHAILTKGKRAFAGVMAAAMLAATAAPVAYAEELPAAQTVAEETTQQETQDFEENTLDTETVDSADSADTSVDSTETAVDTADNEETTDSEEKAEANDTVTGADDESESSDAAQQAIPAEQNTDEPEVAVYAAQGDFSWGNSESSTANSGDISALSAAISNATGTVYVKLNGDVTVPYGSRLNVPAGKTVYLDLAGHTLYTDYGEESTLIQVSGGELHIKDSSTEKTGTLSAGNAGRVVSVIDNGTLILDSGKITKTDRAGDSCLLFIKQSSVTMNGGILTGGNHITHGAVVMNEGGHFTMNGGEIKDNTSIRDATDSGAAIYMAGTTEFTMNGGSITNNTTTSGAGAAISATNATATIAIHGGTISNNSAKKGGAIYFKGTLLLDETSGTLLIQNNTATQNGGAIATTSGSNVIVMKAGTISGNTAGAQYNGGAIFCAGKFTMTGGQITNNISGYGAVCLQSNTAFNMLGGTISGNTGTGSNKRGAGLYSTNSTGEINIGGTAVISGNKLSSPKTNEAESNIYVYSGKLLIILKSGKQVDTGLNETITVNQDWTGKVGVHQGKSVGNNLYQVSQNGDESNIANVIPDNSQYQTIYKGGALYIFAHTSHSWTKTASGNQITYTCNEQYCQYHANPLTLTVNAENMEYTGSAYDKASFADNITPVVTNNTTVSGIIYFMANGTKTSPNGSSGASTAGGAPVNVGEYKAVVTINNYYKAEKAFEITKTQNAWVKNPTITGWTYGDSPNSPVSAAKCGEATVTYAKQGTNNFTTDVPTAAGTYTARFTVEEDTNYTGLTKDVEFTIAPKSITVTPDAKSKAYGEIDPELTYTVNAGGLVGADMLQGIILTRATGENIGEYTISAKQSENANPNYQITFATATFTITPKKVEVNAAGYTGTYDGNAHSITVTVTDPANDAAITYSTEENGSYTADNPTFTNAGEYTVYYKVTSDGYTEEKSSAKVTIQKKPVTAVVSAANKVYDGSSTAAVTATVDTGIAGETLTLSGLSGTFADKNVGENKTVTVSGTMTVTAGANTNANNYTVTYPATATANITAKEVTVTITPNGGTYGNVTPATAKLSGVVAGDNVPVTLTYGDSTTVPANAGSYTVKASISDTNYTLTGNTEAAFVIAKAEVNAPEIAGKVYNGENQTADVSDTNLYTVTKNNGGVAVGTYPVELTLTYANNYKWADTDDAVLSLTFTISKADNEWTTQPKISGWTYGNTAAQPTAAAKYGEYTVTYAAKGSGTFTDEVPTNAGSYTARFTVANTADYAGLSKDVDFEIARKAVTVSGITANDKAYDGTIDATLDFSKAEFDGILENDNLTVTATGAFEKAEAGEWKVTISALKLDGDSVANYVLAADGNQTETAATITTKQITVTITAGVSGTYGEAITPATATPNDVVEGDTPKITLTYTGTANDGTEYNSTEVPTKAGTYTVTATTADPNYTLDADTTTAEFTIAKRPATVTPEDKSKVYEEKDPELTYTVSGVLDGETLKGITLARAKGENAGDYAITAKADANANPNYDMTFAEGTFTIKPKSITNAKVVLGKGLTANGEKQTQTVEKVLLNDKEIPADSYTVTANTATDPGSYTLTITAKGNYTGTIEWTYVIAPAKAEDAPGADIAIGKGTVKVAVKSEGNVPTTTLLTDKAELLAMLVDNGDITADELAQIANGASVDIVLTVKEATVTDAAKAAMAQAAKGYTIGQYLDISLFKYMTVDGVTQDGVALHTTKDALTISVKVPDALINTNGAFNRTYCIVRYHDGTATVLDAAFDAANKTLTFKTDRFSDYAIAYKDTAVPSNDTNTSSNENKQTEAAPTPTPAPASTTAPSTMTRVPQTGDTSNPMLYAVLLVVSIFGLAVSFVCKRRNNK